MNMHQRLAVGKTVRVGDLARVWDGTRWLDGRIRSVGHATTPDGCEVEIKYDCGCVGIQRGQCRHRFLESDCGRLWVRDCPSLRRQRHQQQAAAAREAASSARASPTSTSTTPTWPTAKFHQHLKRKHKREDDDDQERRASNLPSRWRNASDEPGGGVSKKRISQVQLGRGMPEWRLNGNERHRDLQHCQLEEATNHTLAFDRPASSEPSHNNHITTDIPLSPTLEPTDDDAEADGDVLGRTGCGGQADNQPRGNVVDAQDRNQNQRPRQEAAGRGRQQESVDDRERTKQCKNRRKKELKRRQMMKVTEPAEERVASCAAAAVAVEGGSRVVSLAAYEWVHIESRGVLWVEEGPARLVLRPGERIASGPHQRLDLPTAATTPFFWSGSGELCV
jgi:hypothetical protein